MRVDHTVSYSNCSPCCNPGSNGFVTSSGLQNWSTTPTPTVFSGNNCLVTPINLTGNCTPNANIYSWDFGDGTPVIVGTSNLASHTYNSQNNYVITVKAIGPNCYQSELIRVAASYSNCSPCCTPSIQINGSGIQPILTTNNSTVFTANNCLATPLNLNATQCGANTNLSWDFGDGFLYNGLNPPSHSYPSNPSNANYVITVTSSNTTCYSKQIINVAASYSNCVACCANGFVWGTGTQTLAPVATSPTVFTANVCHGTPFNLFANCTTATSYIWKFGDGYITSGSNASHQYSSPGIYDVTVTAVGSNCAQSHLIRATVSSTNCPPCCTGLFFSGTGFQYLNSTATPTIYSAGTCPNANFNLNASACTGATTFSWNYGNGSASVLNVSPSYQYAAVGNYNLTLSAFGPGCYNQLLIQVNNAYTNCPPCCPGGFVNVNSGLYNYTPSGTPNIYTAYTCVNTAISLNASACSAANSFQWNFGNGSPLINNATGTGNYSSAGNYTITVQAWGTNCGAPTQTICVTVTNSQMVLPPTACSGPIVMSANVCAFPAGATFVWNFGDGSSGTGANVTHNYSSASTYNVQLTINVNGSQYSQTSQNITINACQPPQCTNCIGSLAPEPGDYVLSLWVREDITPAPTTYNNAKVRISFTGNSTVYNFGTNISKNRIIDGWQRIEENFTVPNGATHVNLKLYNSGLIGTPDAYFDDIRLFPRNGQMKTYVYDPLSLKLTAILDENNYASFYEYDDEGKLIRIKKETEKGIMTIQENREGLKK